MWDLWRSRRTGKIQGAEKSQLFPTGVGLVVTDFLSRNCEKVSNGLFFYRGNWKRICWDREWQDWNGIEWWVWGFVWFLFTPFHKWWWPYRGRRWKTGYHVAVGERKGQNWALERMANRSPQGWDGDGPDWVQIGAQNAEGLRKRSRRLQNWRPTRDLRTITLKSQKRAVECVKLLYPWRTLQGLLKVFGDFGSLRSICWMGEQVGGGISFLRKEEQSRRQSDMICQGYRDHYRQANWRMRPIGFYDEENPSPRVKGRFGPVIKWNDLFINIAPGHINYDHFPRRIWNELIEKKR